MEKIKIRKAGAGDLDEIMRIEKDCFPPQEAAGRESMGQRLHTFPHTCWVLEDEQKIFGFISAMPARQEKLTDEMYHGIRLYREDGEWLMVFGVDVHPMYQGRGFGGMLIKEMIRETKAMGREGIVLLCKERMIPFYEKFGFVQEGLSESSHGGEKWYSMRIRFRSSKDFYRRKA